MCGLGVVVCFVKSAQGFPLLTHLQKFVAQKQMYQRKGKVQNIVMLAVNSYQGCAVEVPGCHRLLTFTLG